ncbi:MAG TPA: MBL fold metallo-hydrolase [Methanospirillum sp.]|uniref:MBL fold metallo-hydrolase n=1 Tax=Methanospirillum sp. TaxID=45200 RepID=UPI002C16A048|nr:MBL fold metallo-hydrolase [Methanospirillum sp.]HWQ63544.1 MBL fold metallo-hydrolase [Methanospirillum sp.]
MPEENNRVVQLENEVWQQIPGTRSAWVYPFIRKPSITGSNTYIIRSGRNLLVIDPGAISDQMEKVRQVLSAEVTSQNHRIILIAGHIHVDHMYFGLVDRQLRRIGRTIIAAEHWGAEQLEAGDAHWTGSDIVGLPQSPVHVALHLLTPEDKAAEIKRVVNIEGFKEIILNSHQISTNGRTLYGQSMMLEDGDHIDFWHTPGHSRESMSISIGTLLHVGDIPFATNPGIAGRAGWNKSDLLDSIYNIRDHLLTEDTICCPGHGRTFDYSGVMAMVSRMEIEISEMPDLSEYNVKRLNLSLWHGLDLIDEAHRLFPIIAGRMMSLCFRLENMEMEQEAADICVLFSDEQVDQFLLDFNRFYEEFKAGKKIKPEVVHKALQVFEQIEKAFPAESLESVIDRSLLRRARRILSDFLSTIQGVIPDGKDEPVVLISLIHEVFAGDQSGVSDEELITLADDEQAYRQAMVKRIAHHPYAHRLPYHISTENCGAGEDSITILADRQRLYDSCIALIEYLECINAKSLDILLIGEKNAIQMILTPVGPDLASELPLPGSTIREITYAGGIVKSVMEPGKEDIRIEFQKPAGPDNSG